MVLYESPIFCLRWAFCLKALKIAGTQRQCSSRRFSGDMLATETPHRSPLRFSDKMMQLIGRRKLNTDQARKREEIVQNCEKRSKIETMNGRRTRYATSGNY